MKIVAECLVTLIKCFLSQGLNQESEQTTLTLAQLATLDIEDTNQLTDNQIVIQEVPVPTETVKSVYVEQLGETILPIDNY